MVQLTKRYEIGLVSIIIPVFNRADLLGETLDSVCKQAYTRWECIVVDDGSIDHTCKIVEAYSEKDHRIRLLKRPDSIKKGANGCRNLGFQKSRGEYIQWFDSDDIMHPDLIQSSLSEFSPDTDIVISRALRFKNNPLNLLGNSENYEDISKQNIYDILSGKSHFGTPQALFKAKFIIRTRQLFNEELRRNQETEFYIRLLLHNPVISINNRELVFIRLHDDSITSRFNKSQESLKLFLNFHAFTLIYFSCKKYGALNSELLSLFTDFFSRCLRKMEFRFCSYVKLYILVIKEGFYPSRFLATKIFLSRTISNLKLGEPLI